MQNSATQKDYATQNGYMGHVSTLTTRDTTSAPPNAAGRDYSIRKANFHLGYNSTTNGLMWE
jgi:hypothetical protein